MRSAASDRAIIDEDRAAPSNSASADAPPIEPLLPLPFPLELRPVRRPRVCVVMPVYNEEEVLARTHREVAAALEATGTDWSILFVNDGSRDGTVGVLEALYRGDNRVGYLLLSRNFGHQAALTAGLDHADADVVISMDADLQHPPAMLSTLLEAWRQGYDVVHTRKLATVGLPRWRVAATEAAYWMATRLAQVRIIPQASDYRLLDRAVLGAVRGLPETSRLYRGLTSWVGFRQCVVPYVAAQRAAGTSQYSLKQLVGLFTRTVLDYSGALLHAGLLFGGAALALSSVYLAIVLVRALSGAGAPPGGVAQGVILFLTSLTLAFAGVIGAYVARIYNEVRARPPYVLGRVRMHDGSDSDTE